MTCKYAVLLINTGSPANPDSVSVRSFLEEFLSDTAIVDLPHWIWQPILKNIILPLRSSRSANKYKEIWLENGSPLLLGTKKLAGAIEQELQKSLSTEICVKIAMRYGNPSIEKQINELCTTGVHQVIALPLFPQTSVTTTGTIFKEIERLNNTIPIKKASGYGTHPAYIQALAEHLKLYWQSHARAERLIFSFHGIPHKLTALGDTYEQECKQSIGLLVEHLQLPQNSHRIGFQSRFGPGRWLEPATIELIKQAAQDEVKALQIFAPGFAIDCLETLHEIDVDMRADFQRWGGKQFEYIPCMNNSAGHSKALGNLINSLIKPNSEN